MPKFKVVESPLLVLGGEMDKKIVELVTERSQGCCEVCGLPGESMALHHRKLKSRGGKDCASNLIAVHHQCHNLGTRSIHLNPAVAEQNGWMVGSWQEPHEVPMKRPDGSVVLLQKDGSVIFLERT